jgi:hypothetical protein
LIAREPVERRPTLHAWLPPRFLPPQVTIASTTPSTETIGLRLLGTHATAPLSADDVLFRHPARLPSQQDRRSEPREESISQWFPSLPPTLQGTEASRLLQSQYARNGSAALCNRGQSAARGPRYAGA